MEPINKKRSLAAIVGASASAALLWFTPHFEGTKLTTYRDIGGVLTYCTGATENAKFGATYTPEQCRAQLDHDLAVHAEGVVECVTTPLTDGQKVAFVDVAYNIGIKAFCQSSMARKANAHDLPGACASLSLWDRVNGQVIHGLSVRREAERKLCEGGLS